MAFSASRFAPKAGYLAALVGSSLLVGMVLCPGANANPTRNRTDLSSAQAGLFAGQAAARAAADRATPIAGLGGTRTPQSPAPSDLAAGDRPSSPAAPGKSVGAVLEQYR